MTIKQLFGSQKTYVIRCQTFVKIGIARDPEARRASLQVGCPYLLTLVHVMDGNCEAELHKRFARYSIRGEWFWDEGELSKWLKEMLSISDTYRGVR